MTVDLLTLPGMAKKKCYRTPHSYENLAHQTWLDFDQWLRRIEHNRRTDTRAEAITIPPLKRGGDNKEEHHVTCTNWIPLYIHTRKPVINMYYNYTCRYYLYFPIQDMDW